jgi:hypothetical protein
MIPSLNHGIVEFSHSIPFFLDYFSTCKFCFFCQVGFGSFVAKMNFPSPAMTMTSKHAVYEMEENYATIVERFRCHLTEERGLVWCGLPSMSPIQWEPSTTVIKVTNTHTHTHTQSWFLAFVDLNHCSYICTIC